MLYHWVNYSFANCIRINYNLIWFLEKYSAVVLYYTAIIGSGKNIVNAIRANCYWSSVGTSTAEVSLDWIITVESGKKLAIAIKQHEKKIRYKITIIMEHIHSKSNTNLTTNNN